MTNDKLPTLEKLDDFYNEHGNSNPVLLPFNCIQCGRRFELELHRTSQGFGINGGILLVTSDDQLLGRCVDCHKQTDKC
jgi:hypothetical protein